MQFTFHYYVTKRSILFSTVNRRRRHHQPVKWALNFSKRAQKEQGSLKYRRLVTNRDAESNMCLIHGKLAVLGRGKGVKCRMFMQAEGAKDQIVSLGCERQT